MRKLKAQSSKLKAQSSKLKPLITHSSIKGFTLLELIITLSILGIITAVAVPNFVTMVQNNRIKNTTNHIISTLQFARQSAAINRKTVTACTPLPSDTSSCALTYNWNNGVLVLEGAANIQPATIPNPPQPLVEPTLELISPPEAKQPENPKVATDLITYDNGGISYRAYTSGMGYDAACNYQGHYMGDHVHTISISYTDADGKTVSYGNSWSEIVCTYWGDAVKTFRPNPQHESRYQAAKKEYDKILKQFNETNEKAMNDYKQQHSDYQKALADQAKVAKINAQRQAAYEAEYKQYESDLPKYNAAKKIYDDELASKPSMAVTLDNPNKLLANNPFTVTVSNNLKSGALIYKHDKLAAGGGRIDITDRRGKGEHSRSICVNILGNIKVIKGNQNCP